MFLFDKDTDKEIVVIAEVGMNHGGSVEWVKEIVPKLKEAGVDAVKFQLFTPSLFISPSNTQRFEQVSKRALSRTQFEEIYDFCQDFELSVFATAVSHDWVPFIATKCGVLKIASGDFVFSPTIDSALRSNAKLVVSTGATTREEIKEFVQKAKGMRPGNHYHESIGILHCISSYPPKLEQANLNAIPDLKILSGLTVGFSSHFMEDAPIYASLALGARIFEIHVTNDRNQTDFRDHALSRTPEELGTLVSSLNKMSQSLMLKEKSIQPDEQENQLSLRKGLTYSKSFALGHLINESDVSFARPANPEIHNIAQVIGRKLNRNVQAHDPISMGDFF